MSCLEENYNAFVLPDHWDPNTRFLIADEMTTMLDAITQAQIWNAVLEIAKKREMGIVVVSHEAKLIQRLCHRVIDLNHFNS